ncbi:unnamed protein product [Thlaspi arvense]|uniref:Uncharacterized protein n=1 Tax=Thlaspi arvense TaxID=13288 RepID=A0AAU9RFJ2_THLAR|nr:unnamed protein product [Thlaspi arvense]
MAMARQGGDSGTGGQSQPRRLTGQPLETLQHATSGRIWAAAIVYYIAIVQQQTYAVFQALQSNRHLGRSKFQIPAGTYPVFNMLTFTLFIPLYDRVLVPALRRVTGKPSGITILQRMGIGNCPICAHITRRRLVERQRRSLVPTGPTAESNKKGVISGMSAMWLVPQFSLAGLAEAFTSVGQVELYYKQFPENMRSIAGSFFFCGMAASSYLSGFLVSVVHHWTQDGGDCWRRI